MPEISSLPAMPAVVAAGPITAAGATPAVAAEANGAGLSFLASLKTALATLATAAMPQVVALTAPTTPVAEPPLPEPAPAAADTVSDETTDAMPEMLAALGFLPVPTVLAAPVEPESAPSEVRATTSTRQAVALPVAQPVAEPAPRADDVPALPTDAKPLDALTQELTPADAAPAHLKAAAEQLVARAAQPPTQTQAQPHEAEPAHGDAASAPATAPVLNTPVPHHAAAQHFGGHGTSADDSDKQDQAPAVEAAAAPSTPSIEPRIEAAAAGITTTAPIANAALPPHVRPSEVVNQIAHQADLYRLPGNKGVRIQLHPEDLGGVDVTLRYSAAGGIQLHINVEHASTGALVQAGWHELRDALATQGITPDRLIMSVTAPNDASAMDFSSNNSGSYRSDAGLASFGQGSQSGGQRQDAEPQRVARGWFAETADASNTVADEPSSVAAGSARIDYRV